MQNYTTSRIKYETLSDLGLDDEFLNSKSMIHERKTK